MKRPLRAPRLLLTLFLAGCGGTGTAPSPPPPAPSIDPYWACEPSNVTVRYAGEVSPPPDGATAWTVRGCDRGEEYWCFEGMACRPAICFAAAVSEESLRACRP